MPKHQRLTLLSSAAMASLLGTSPALAQDDQDENELVLYGYAQLDIIQDFDRVDPDWDSTLRPSRIPTTKGEFGGDGNTDMSVKQSRFGVRGSTMVDDKKLSGVFEFDMFGVGDDAGETTIRLRHAYAEWGPLLGGQTNSLMYDGDAFPNVIDYWGPTGQMFVRNPQLRFTPFRGDWGHFAVALERPSDDIDPGNIRQFDPALGDGLKSHEKLPDFTMQVRYQTDAFYIQLAGLARRIGYETVNVPSNEPKGHEFGWGLAGTSVVRVTDAMRLKAGGSYGQGMASYFNDGGTDLAPEIKADGTIKAKAVKIYGMFAYAEVDWTPKWSSAFGYSRTDVKNTNFQADDAFDNGQYASGNIIYTPYKNILAGLEFLWGRREDNDGDHGKDMRLQASIRWSFSTSNLLD